MKHPFNNSNRLPLIEAKRGLGGGGDKAKTCRRLLKPSTSSQADDLPKTGALSILSTYDVENSIEQISLKSFPGIRFFVESDFPLTLN